MTRPMPCGRASPVTDPRCEYPACWTWHFAYVGLGVLLTAMACYVLGGLALAIWRMYRDDKRRP